MSRAEYEARVTEAREHILAGDAFEICLTTAFDAAFERTNAWPLFRRLCTQNPSPYAAFIDLPEGAIVSSSPERFLTLDRAGNAETRPIKGTRPRSADPIEDARLRAELAASEKDRAENAMIVDLSRNDLGKVCTNVSAPDLYKVESYPTVHQLVSTVCGQLRPDKDAIDLLRACFPPGSMTGAPKIEAMRILEHLEPVERGPYAGALGWIDDSGTMDLSVVIRTAVITNDGLLRFAAGGAVTADSDPTVEYEEMLAKTRGLRAALEGVGGS
jgi:anthranilate/para-aminobenzoate synthase component I